MGQNSCGLKLITILTISEYLNQLGFSATEQKLPNDGTKNGTDEKHHHHKKEKYDAVTLGAGIKQGHSTDSTDGTKPCR